MKKYEAFDNRLGLWNMNCDDDIDIGVKFNLA